MNYFESEFNAQCDYLRSLIDREKKRADDAMQLLEKASAVLWQRGENALARKIDAFMEAEST